MYLLWLGQLIIELYLNAVLQRLVVALSCIAFWFLATGQSHARNFKSGYLVLLTAFACVEKLCSIMNLISVERDWVGLGTCLHDGDKTNRHGRSL